MIVRLRMRACRDRWFAIAEAHYENYWANVWYEGLDTRGRGRVQMAAELPLMYPRGRVAHLPAIRWPGAESAAPRTLKPRPGILEATAFLKTLPVFRYAAPDRGGARAPRA